MKGKIFLILMISCLFGGVLFALSSGVSLKGIFPLNNGWSGDGGTTFTGGGYPGVVSYGVGGASIMPDGSLSGNLWMGNAGWATFSHGVSGLTAKIECPTDIWTVTTQPCPMSGYAWSQNAGWIAMSATDIGTGSGVYFNPNTSNLEGWGWSSALGWIPMWTNISATSIAMIPTTPIDPLPGVPINFISRIAIVGNIAGSRVFSVANNGVVNQDVGYSYKTINHADILNMIRKNIALMTRNVEDSDMDDPNDSPDFVVIKNKDLNIQLSSLTPYITAGKRSLIVIGGDIVIDDVDVNSLDWSQPTIGLIALKDASGKGGNIVITGQVKRIYAYLYAEGSLFSGYKLSSSDPIVSYSSGGVWNIPQNQLYIRGFLVSKNTIAGSTQSPPVCPSLVASCTQANIQAYDLDYFRNYDQTVDSQSSLPAERQTVEKLQKATMIIEYDAHILTDPPPGLQEPK